MPRLSKQLVEERESYATDQFKAGADMDECNAALVQKYGMKMGYYRLKELFDAAQDKKPVVVEAKFDLPEVPEITLPKGAIISEGPFYTIPELIKRLENGEYDAQ
jgi:hypothetical protein